MSKKLYQDMQKVASKLFATFDQSNETGQEDDGLWYIKLTPGAGPVDNPGAPTETAYKLNGVAKGVSFRYIDGTNILATDMQCKVAISPVVTPDIRGFMKMGGKRHKILQTTTIPPVGVPIATLIIFGERK